MIHDDPEYQRDPRPASMLQSVEIDTDADLPPRGQRHERACGAPSPGGNWCEAIEGHTGPHWFGLSERWANVEGATVHLDNRDAVFVPTGPAWFDEATAKRCSCAWTMTTEHRSTGEAVRRLAQVDPKCPTHGPVDGPSVHGERPGGLGEYSATPEGARAISGRATIPVRVEAADAVLAELDKLRRQVQAVRELCEGNMGQWDDGRWLAENILKAIGGE